jgi:tetratricopeptide (TPR) repeat protein
LNQAVPKIALLALLLGLLPLSGHDFLACGEAMAQSDPDKRDKDLDRGDRLYALGQLERSIPYYERGLQRAYDPEACARLALAHRQQGHYGDAEHWFRQAVLADYLDPLYYREFAEVLRANGKSDEALQWFERYDRYTIEPEPYREDYALAAREYGQEPVWRVLAMDLNSSWREIAPAFAPGGGVVFASDRPAKATRSFAKGERYFDLFRHDGAPASSAPPLRIKGHPNGPWHDAGFAVDPMDGSVWFTRTASKGNRRLRSSGQQVLTAIYRAEYRKGKLRKPERFGAIKRSWAAAHPSFSPDGQRLYFSAAPLEQLDRPMEGQAIVQTDATAEGFGGLDIWYCERSGKRWSRPINAGARINTEGDESWPYSAGPDRLYLASDGHPGLGGLDLFVAERTAGRWSELQHLPAPMSSPRDDFALVVRDNQGWFASDRMGGRGMDDLYAFERIGVEVLVRIVNAESGQPIAGVSVECFAEGTEQSLQRSDARGESRFAVQAGQPFYLSLNKQGFEPVILSDTRDRERFTVAMEPVSRKAPKSPEASPDQSPDQSLDEGPGNAAKDRMSDGPVRETDAAAPQAESSPSGENQARAEQEAGYRIRIGVFRSPDMARLQRLERFGTLIEEPRDQGVRAFYLGTFADAAVAADVLARVRVAGFTDAFVEKVSAPE